MKYFSLACPDAPNGSECRSLGKFYEARSHDGDKDMRDIERAFLIFFSRCRAAPGSPSCLDLARLHLKEPARLESLHVLDWYGETARAQAEHFAQLGCEGGEGDGLPGCMRLARFYAEDTDEPERALDVFTHICHDLTNQKEYGKACLSAARMHERGEGSPKSPKTAALFYERACKAKVDEGCSALGR